MNGSFASDLDTEFHNTTTTLCSNKRLQTTQSTRLISVYSNILLLLSDLTDVVSGESSSSSHGRADGAAVPIPPALPTKIDGSTIVSAQPYTSQGNAAC